VLQEDSGSSEEEPHLVGRARVAAAAVRRGSGGALRPRSMSSLDSAFFFFFINRGGQLICLGKSVIYHELIFEVYGLPTSVNPFCLPRKKFYVVV